MPSLYSRVTALGELIRMKQKAFRVRTSQLSLIINNKRHLKRLKRVNFQFQTIPQLLKRLIFINTGQLTVMLVLSLVSLILRLFCANINTLIVGQFQQQQSATNLVYCIILLTVYKLVKAIIDQYSSYLQMRYGFMGYSSLYYHFLKSKNHMTGEILNIVEDDMQKLSNLPYSLINFPFLSILIIVLTVLLACTLQANVILIIVIAMILYLANCIGGVCIFYLNEKLMQQKDYRLGLNLSQNNDTQMIKQARRKQVAMTRTFLMVKVVVKWLTEFSFVLLYGFVFLWSTEEDNDDDELYYRLMLLGMLKIAFNSLFMESYYIALVLNSLKRILICQHREEIEKSTIGSYEDFLKKNAQKKLLNNSERQSTESSLSQQSSISGSLQSSTLRLTAESIEVNTAVREMKSQHHNGKQIKKPKKKYTERGQIKILQLGKYIKENIQFLLYAVSILLGLGTFYIKYQSLMISSAILHMNMGVFEYVVFFAPAVLYTLFYLSVILIFVQVSKNLFKDLNAKEIQGEDLNRISGDIDMVDKYVPPSFYEFFITIFGLLASLVLTVSSIKDSFLAILTATLLLAIIWLCIYLNRYFMKSRRQLKRLECKNKSSIIQRYAQQISQQSEEQVKFNKVEKNWKRINLLKNIGIVIENYYILILNVLVLVIQILCFIVCFVGGIDRSTGKLILTFILQLDLSLTGMLLNTIYLEMGLVNFQRCLNFVKRIKANNNNNNNSETHETKGDGRGE